MLNKLHITDTESKIWFNSPDSNAQSHKKNQGFAKKFPGLWTRASESGLLNQIFDLVSVILSLFNI
jgi:hypothetical protein